MKKHSIYLILILISLISLSCEDWLDVSPKAEVEASELFETEQGFEDALNGLYIGLSDSRTYGQNLSWYLLEFWAHQYDVQGGTLEELQNYDYQNSTSVSNINSIWLKQYNTISGINLLLESIDKYGSVLDTAAYNATKGEALAMRALCHFDLLRLFGHGNLENRAELGERKTIPYVTTYSNKITPQESYSKTFQLLEKDIEEALSYLNPEIIEQTHICHRAVLALQARVFLWQGKKAEALKTAEQLLPVINGGWASDAAGAIFTGEHLFHLNVTKLYDYMEFSYESHLNGNFNDNRLVQTGSFVRGIYNINDAGEGEGLSDRRYIKQHTFVTEEEWLTTKLKIDLEETSPSDYMIPMLKIAEVYLIAIECYASDGAGQDLAKAIEYLNYLKEVRNIQPDFFIAETATQEEIEMAIFNEYRKEFIQEGQLFYFYKRKGLLDFPRQMGEAIYEMNDSKYVLPYPEIEIESGRVQDI